MLYQSALFSLLCLLITVSLFPDRFNFVFLLNIFLYFFHPYLHVSLQGWFPSKGDYLFFAITTPKWFRSWLKCIEFPWNSWNFIPVCWLISFSLWWSEDGSWCVGKGNCLCFVMLIIDILKNSQISRHQSLSSYLRLTCMLHPCFFWLYCLA